MSCDNYGIIAHYQKIIKKSRNDEQKLHYCIEKLFGLPITIEHLQKTGIGKTINSLRKCNGDVGTAAKALVSKWKAMIANLDSPNEKEGYKSEDKTGRTGDIPQLSNQKVDKCERNASSKANKYNVDNKFSSEQHGSSDNKPKSTACNDSNSRSSGNLGAYSGSEQKRPKSKNTDILEKGEIDCSMGASFSDALVMCNENNNKKLKSLKRQSQDKNSLKHLSKQKKSNEQDAIISAELIPLAQEIDNTMALTRTNTTPKINDNYTPNAINRKIMNFTNSPIHREKLNILKDDSLNIGISSKTKRTKVYSGMRTGALLTVPSLFDMCIRVLQKNVDALEYTGGVPFDVLRPVLERTSPQQLLAVEHFNPYLMDDTDILWEQHVKRNFRKDTKQDGETWREMFMRCENEKEYKLSILTTNIKKAQKESALPVKKTRLAYVDHAAKPPRNIQRKQELYGTNAQHIASPAARVPSLSSTSSNVLLAGDPRLKSIKNIPHTGGNTQMHQKKAPLMAKTLKFIKKRYKR